MPDRSTIVLFLATGAIGWFYSPWASVLLLAALFLVGLMTAFTLTSVVRNLMPAGMDRTAGKLSLMLLHGFMMQHTTGGATTAVAFAPGPDAGKSETARRLKNSQEIKQIGRFIGLAGPVPFFPAYELLRHLESR